MEQLRKKIQNFWFYYKIPFLVGLAVVFILGYLTVQKHTTVQPDYHIGLVRTVPCTDMELQGLKDTFTATGQDLNGDGEVLVQIHTYYVNLEDPAENAGVANADTIQALDAALIGNVSGIFLLEDVAAFQTVTNNLLSDTSATLENGLHMTIRKNSSSAYQLLFDNIF